MTSVVYIAGLGHSGSTILDMSLGCHPMVVGMGEVASLLGLSPAQLERSIPKLTCSCREDVHGCPVWSPLIQAIRAHASADYATKYQELLRVFRTVYGDRRLLVDSSKGLRSLTAIREVSDLRVIFLIRDVRGWVYSRHTMLGRSMLRLSYSWLANNRRIKASLDRDQFRYFQLGYEEFALYPEFMLKKLCDFVGIEFHPDMLTPTRSHSHVISGNIVRHDRQKAARIAYDNRWFVSNRLSLLTPLILPALHFNSRNTYGNIITGQESSFRARSKRQHPKFVMWNSEGKKEVIAEKRQILKKNEPKGTHS